MTKINHNITALIGAIFSVFPIYNFLSWVIIFEKYSDYSQKDKVKLFHESWFNWFENASITPSLLSVLFGAIAIALLVHSLSKSKSERKESSIVQIIKVVVVVITSFSTFMALWWMM